MVWHCETEGELYMVGLFKVRCLKFCSLGHGIYVHDTEILCS